MLSGRGTSLRKTCGKTRQQTDKQRVIAVLSGKDESRKGLQLSFTDCSAIQPSNDREALTTLLSV